MNLEIRPLCGQQILPYIDDLAALRIEVFRAFPYLYDGDREYERRYLTTHASSPESLFVLALDGAQVVGVSTGMPMADEEESFQAPFLAAGYDPRRIFYFGESVLKPQYRGQGVGVAFFNEREAYARRLERFDRCCFCAVERPKDHPLRPADYVPLDRFWNQRGFFKQPALKTTYEWKDVGEEATSAKSMCFWLKSFS